MPCLELEQVAADLALGLASGDERAAALSHVEWCPACRELVEELSRAADALVLLAPDVEPRAGFEQRVMAALDVPSRRRWARVLVCAAAVALILVAGGLVGRLTAGSGPSSSLARARMVTPGAVDVGEVYVLRGDAGFVLITVPRWSGQAGDYYVQLGLDDGTTTALAAASVDPARGSYAAAVSGPGATVVKVALVDAAGRVLCAAELPA
jgi:hypothetical protein